MASSISEAQAELISSLSPDDIPIKLRCAICSKLAVNAFRLPCCEQAICELCQSDIPSSCPVCEHSPLSAEDCNPNKSLRTTIRVFLRTAEKKREASRPKQPIPAASTEESKPTPTRTDSATAEIPVRTNVHDPSFAGKEEAVPQPTGSEGAQVSDQVNMSQSVEVTTKDDTAQPASNGLDAREGTNEGTQEISGDNAQPTRPAGEEGGDDGDNGQEDYGSDAMSCGYNNTMFSGSGDLNQMQMMMAMQNGMGSNSFSNFPMMGMPGMGMDPMAMQNMYMNGGFQGMGMNGMGGGFGGGFGQGSMSNDWTGSQSWNYDQNNYNQNGTGMGTGDFGNFNSGFQTGYNQGNYGHFNDYRRNNYGRGRGRGRGFYGGYGRGGYQYNGTSNYQGHGQTQGQFMQQQVVHAHAEPNQTAASTNGNAEDGTEQAETGEGAQGAGSEPQADSSQDQASDPSSSRDVQGNASGSGVIQTVLSAPEIPINAPTGPKAMRQGLPNTSLHTLRVRGYQVVNEGQHQMNPAASRPTSGPAAEAGSQCEGDSLDREQEPYSAQGDSREQSRDYESRDRNNPDSQPPSRTRSQTRSQRSTRSHSRSRSRSRSKSPSRSHKSSHRRRRQCSESDGEDDYHGSYRHKKYRSSSKKHHYGDDEYQSTGVKQDDRTRSASPDKSKRPSHRSHRDKDKDRDYESRRDRDKDRYRDDDKAKSSRSSHRDRDRDRDYDSSRRRDKERDRDRDRKDRKERRRDRDRDRNHRDRDRGRDREKGHTSSSRRTSTSRDRDKPSHSSSTDPHTLEREARNRERLLKEAQRMAGLASLAGSKRNRDDGGDESSSRKGKRSSRRSEAHDGADDEERMRRLEAEREGGRWG